MTYAKNITELIGNTPLIQINHLTQTNCTILAKMEMNNPGGSVKDRAALSIIQAAEKSGELLPGGTIVEATSGNTGIALSMVGAALGYKVVIAMPSSMSIERRKLMTAYGAKLLLTDPAKGMAGAKSAAETYLNKHPRSVYASQFSNPANPQTHYQNTGKEIWEQTNGKIDAFIAGVGSGGTVSGVGKYLKEKNPQISVFAVEPAESPLLTQKKSGTHKIQGIGANFIPQNYDPSVVDKVITIDSQTAITTAQAATTQEGLLVGFSAGANLAATASLANLAQYQGKTLVTVLPDTGERYLTTSLFETTDESLTAN